MSNPVGKTFRLFYQDIELGEVTQENFNFPSFFCKFRRNEEAFAGNPLREKLQRYFEHSLAVDRLLMDGKEDGPEMDAAVIKAEQFMDFIESNDWYLYREGEKEPILIPNFVEGNSVVLRLNVTGIKAS